MTITLTPSTYTIVPEGIHTFRIKSATYEDKFGRVQLVCETKEGNTLQTRYDLINPTTRQPNEGAMKSFSYFCRIVLQDWSVADIDPNTLVGRYFASMVIHKDQASNTRIGETITYANLSDKWSADSFEDYSKVKDREGNPIPLDTMPSHEPKPGTIPMATAPAPQSTPIAPASNPVATPLPLSNPAPTPTPTPTPTPAPTQAAKPAVDLASLFGK